MKVAYCDLPEDLRKHYTQDDIYKAEMKGSSTITVHRVGGGKKDVWKKGGKSWNLQEAQPKKESERAPLMECVQLFGQPIPRSSIKRTSH
jgi:hypothetical protein